jgi:hypothetical protein
VSTKVAATKSSDPLVVIHARIPKSTQDRLFALLATMRTKEPMANLTDAIRAALDAGLKKVAR